MTPARRRVTRSRSVFVALQEKQLRFDLLTVDLGSRANHEERYTAKSVTQRVPMLIHGGLCFIGVVSNN